MKLLIVDDDILLCSALSRNLIRLGHSSRTVSSVEAALTLIASESPAAVLTDLDLGPGGDGVDLISRLRAGGSTLPTIMMTGSDLEMARARLTRAGLDEIAILEKPFQFEDLIQKLIEILPEATAPHPLPAPGRGTPNTSMAAMKDSVVRTLGGRLL
jgi:two-component system, OmpR family, response regulator MprA